MAPCFYMVKKIGKDRASSGMAKNPGKDTMLGPCDLWPSFNQQTFPFNGPRMDDLKT